MTIYLQVPGQLNESVTVADNATLETFCRRAFEQTGIPIFNGFGYSGANTIGAPLLSSNAGTTPWDRGALASPPTSQGVGTQVALNVAPSTGLSTLFNSGDVVNFMANTPVGA